MVRAGQQRHTPIAGIQRGQVNAEKPGLVGGRANIQQSRIPLGQS